MAQQCDHRARILERPDESLRRKALRNCPCGLRERLQSTGCWRSRAQYLGPDCSLVVQSRLRCGIRNSSLPGAGGWLLNQQWTSGGAKGNGPPWLDQNRFRPCRWSRIPRPTRTFIPATRTRADRRGDAGWRFLSDHFSSLLDLKAFRDGWAVSQRLFYRCDRQPNGSFRACGAAFSAGCAPTCSCSTMNRSGVMNAGPFGRRAAHPAPIRQFGSILCAQPSLLHQPAAHSR